MSHRPSPPRPRPISPVTSRRQRGWVAQSATGESGVKGRRSSRINPSCVVAVKKKKSTGRRNLERDSSDSAFVSFYAIIRQDCQQMPLLSWSQPNRMNPTACLPLGSAPPIFLGSPQPCGDRLGCWRVGVGRPRTAMSITSKHLRRLTDHG